MLLKEFIDEIKHNSTNLIIIDQKPEEDVDWFIGTKGVIINNVKYLNTYKYYKIISIEPADDMFPGFKTFEICITEEEDTKPKKEYDPMDELFYKEK